ncbi:MAG TPA: helix-turn-helix domain-containing protein [Dermatophilaceae bacterium]|jgi:PucR C-terminal helix-turn-helix domain/GGDEF-like domain
MAAHHPRGSAATQRSIEHSSAALSTAANKHMETHYDWYRELSAEDRSWVGLVAQAGIAAFIAWYRDPGETPALSVDVFGTAPRELTRSISLVQTLDLVRSVVDVVEEEVARLAAPGDEQNLREAALRYAREVAFAAAQVYAGAAEARGAWDARLESLVIDAVLRGEADDSMQSRASALGWGSVSHVAVVAGMSPEGNAAEVVDLIRRAASRLKVDSLASVQGQRLVVILGNLEDPSPTVRALAQHFGDGPIVLGPTVPHLFAAGRSARAAISGLAAARAWPDAPRPVLADELLVERVLAGDATARRALIDRIYHPLSTAGKALFETATTYLDGGGGLESTARVLFIHPNTVRYRLGRIAVVTGYDLSQPREAYTVRVALAVGRLAESSSRGWRRSLQGSDSVVRETIGGSPFGGNL